MFGKIKDTKKNKRPASSQNDLLKELGIHIPGLDDADTMPMDDDDDPDLQAELKALQGGTASPATKRSKPKTKPTAQPAGGLQDFQSFQQDVKKFLDDIDRPVRDEELSDVDESELLDELKELGGDVDEPASPTAMTKPASHAAPPPAKNAMVSLLEERQNMYVKAIEKAKASQESAKARRYERQLNAIKELLQSARAGAPIKEEDIPPALSVAPPSSSQSQPEPVRAPSPPRPAPQPEPKPVAPAPTSANSSSEQAIARLKALALQARAAGDMDKAREYLIELKRLQGESTAKPAQAPLPTPAPSASEIPQSEPAALPLKAPIPTTVLEALEQRHAELTRRYQEASTNNETAKARRFDRQVKQYQEAIDATKRNRPYDYSELPELPGFAPIPLPGQQAKAAAPVRPEQGPAPTSNPPVTRLPVPQQPAAHRSLPAESVGSLVEDGKGNQDSQSLRLKREQFLKFANQAKEKGDWEKVKKCMSAVKTIDEQLKKSQSTATISSSHHGSSASLPADGFDVIQDDEFTEELAQCDRETVYSRLKADLLQQIQLCARNQQMFAHMPGEMNAQYANQFKMLEQRSSHQLEQVKQSYQKGFKAPIFHYEKRQLNLIQTNLDLTENDLEVTVIRGINLPVPSGYSAQSLDTYVVLALPYPTETPQTGRTRHATGASIAEYPDARFKFTIKRSDTKLIRGFQRKELRLDIFYKAGFLRADRQLGIANMKLAGLITHAVVHDTVDIYDEHRKKAQGKIEVKIRLREALGPEKASELTMQRWLVIDRFDDTPQIKKPSLSKSPDDTAAAATGSFPFTNTLANLVTRGPLLDLLAINLAGNQTNDVDVDDDDDNEGDEDSSSSGKDVKGTQQRQSVPKPTGTGPLSIQVLKYEAQLIQEQIEKLEDHLTPDQIEHLRAKRKALKDQAQAMLDQLEQGGQQAVEKHIQGLKILVDQYDREANDYDERNEKKKAELMRSKKKRVLGEIETLQKPSPPPSTVDNPDSF